MYVVFINTKIITNPVFNKLTKLSFQTTIMNYTLDTFKHIRGLIYTTSDNHKYLVSKRKSDNTIYLKCVLFREGCKATVKLNQNSLLIDQLASHNHEIDSYNADIYSIKAKCKEAAKVSRANLREVFNDVTRIATAGRNISFTNCESTMYRSRRELQPKIPQTLLELEEALPGTPYGINYKGTINVGNDRAFIFFSEEIIAILADISEICFDGTFYTVPIQFYQLWTIFIVVNHHVFPAIHCLLTGKSQELYESLLVKIQSLISHFHPDVSMSDWEMAARNAFKSTFHGIRLKGCWFHYTQRIWKHVQKANLKHSYNNNVEIQNFVRYIMALPFLPPYTILQIFNQIDTLDLNLQDDELMNKVKKKNPHRRDGSVLLRQ